MDEYLSYKRQDVLNELGAQTFGREIWDTISDSQPPKQLVNRRIILPLTMEDLSRKHGVSPSADDHFLRASGDRQDPFRQGHSRGFVLVVYRDRAEHAHGGRGR